MTYRIVARDYAKGKLFYVQRNKFWKWVNLDTYGNPAKYPRFYKEFDDAYDSLQFFKTPKEDIVIFTSEEQEK